MELSRRDLIKLGLFSSAALMLPLERVARTAIALNNRIPQSELPLPFTVPFVRPPVIAPVRQTSGTDYYALVQQQASVEILPGLRTDIWGYNGITPGPTIMNTQGRQAVVQQINALPSRHPTLGYNVWTSTHLHGSCSRPEYDGYASDITNPGEWKDYVYPNIQDARTLWYHDHGVHITAPNAYMGLAAMYILHDPVELSLPIPHGDYDVPLCLKDAMFERNGNLIFDDNNHSGMYGDVILVNGRPWPAMPVERRKYRFRVLNSSVSRSYDLALDTGEPMVVIGTDGGLMPHPQPVGHFRVGMAERYEIVIDFSKYRVGQRVVLQNLQPPNNIEFATTNVIMAFDVAGEATSTANNEIPLDLNPDTATMGLTEADAVKTRQFNFERKNGAWTINGTTWDDVVNSNFEFVTADPGFNDVEIWELKNASAGWFHPIHIHLVDFKVLDRNGLAPLPHELGPKDVVYVGENETVRVIMRFAHQTGRYMMHCHNLVHEDHDMMTQFRVGAGGDDPIHGDPAAPRPERPLSSRNDDPDEGDGEGVRATPPAPGAPAPAAAKAVQVRGIKKRSKPKLKRTRKVKKRVAKTKLHAKPKPKPKHHAKPKPKPKRKSTRRHR